MTDHDIPRTRKCSTCKKEFPETEEYFHRRTGGGFRSACRACYNGQRQKREDDGLAGGVRETQRKIAAAFQRIDPNGLEANELHNRLHVISRRFRQAPLATKVEVLMAIAKALLDPLPGGRMQ